MEFVGSWRNKSTWSWIDNETNDAQNEQTEGGIIAIRGTMYPSLQAWLGLVSRRPSSSKFLRIILVSLIIIGLTAELSSAALIDFENCLSPNVVNSAPLQLQFIPTNFSATFNTTFPSHNLNVTVYGNVAGQATEGPYPPPEDPSWTDPNSTFGKIVDLSQSNNRYTTLLSEFNVLSYTPFDAPATRFCNDTVRGKCPIVPLFNANESTLADFPAFSIAHDLYSTYAFTTISSTLTVISGDAGAPQLACVSASITPDLGNTISSLLAYMPLVILVVVGIATASAAIFSPWGTTDVFRWTSNYGRDVDVLRLITPGFGDCLQYIQFVILAGSLSLNYPGFYQPVVSQAGWSVLMFNKSFVSHETGNQSVIDGIYVVRGNYGLDRMSQLVGLTADKDIWAGMMIWLLIVVAAVVVLIQIGFVCRWLYRHIFNTQVQDLRAKGIPFTVGNAVRIVYNYFLLPIFSLSMYQLVVASHSPASTVGLAALTLIALIGFAGWILWLVAFTRPRSYLFDDLPTVLLYGPLYNTYSDDAATFALIPVTITFVRGVAIGAVQPSGIAQLVLLAICEVIVILTLNAFRPFHSPTSMNAFHTLFAIVRLATIILSVAFVPSLGVNDAARGWIGYVILLIHAVTLFFGFFLHSLQTLTEVLARLAGAGGEEGVGGGAARGGLVKVFGMRQLSRRNPRRAGRDRHSMASDAAMLTQDNDQKSIHLSGGRSRSLSGSSAILLNRQPLSDHRRSVGLDSVSVPDSGHNHRGSGSAPYTPTTPGGASALSYVPGGSQTAGQGGSPGGTVNLKASEVVGPYYRPPRARRATMDPYSPGSRSRASWASGDWAQNQGIRQSPDPESFQDPVEGPSTSGRATPLPAHLGTYRDRSDSNLEGAQHVETDYATREVDYYYGVRGPMLSTLPTRRLKTGPADPEGPVSSATGWFKSLFGGKIKDKGKGFEVVRSSRVPSHGVSNPATAGAGQEPYRDNPDVEIDERTRDLELSDEGDAVGAGTRRIPDENSPSPLSSGDEIGDDLDSEEDSPSNVRASQISQFPPSLPIIDTVGGIELPSRLASKSSSNPSRRSTERSRRRPPTVPRKSSKRTSSQGHSEFGSDNTPRLSAIASSPPSTPLAAGFSSDHPVIPNLQSSQSSHRRLPFETGLVSHLAGRKSIGGESSGSSILPTNDNASIEQAGGHAQPSASALSSYVPSVSEDRPSSMGYVQQHRASDNIHTPITSSQPFLGSTAELVDDRNSMDMDPRTRVS